MLAAPGGLYLDVKSGYSKAQQLKWFASTLAGIGVNVKVGALYVSVAGLKAIYYSTH